MGYSKIIKVLEETVAHAEDISVTVRPGATVEDIRAALEKKRYMQIRFPLSKKVQKGAKALIQPTEYSTAFPDDSDIYYQLEGYLFLKTYKFYKNDDPRCGSENDRYPGRDSLPEMRKAAEQKDITYIRC